jgi:hypothetical protein
MVRFDEEDPMEVLRSGRTALTSLTVEQAQRFFHSAQSMVNSSFRSSWVQLFSFFGGLIKNSIRDVFQMF